MSNQATVSLEDLNSSYISAELAPLGINHVRFIAEGGEGENHISVYEFRHPGDDFGYRVAKTNALPVWEEQDPAEFAELLESVGIDA